MTQGLAPVAASNNDYAPPLAPTRGRRLARFVVRHRRWVIAAWLVAAAGLAPLAGRVERELEVAVQVRGSEATALDAELATRFRSPFAHFAVLVVTNIPAPDSPAGREALRAIVAAIDSTPGVSGTMSYLSTRDTVFLAADRAGTFVVVGLDPGAERLDAMVPRLRERGAAITVRVRESHPAATLRWTGEVPINFDLRQTSASDARRAESRVLPLTLTLLILAFGAIVAATLPIAAATLAILISLGIAVLINTVSPLSVLLQNVVSMIGLGVGIDYALLTVSRFREALAEGHDATDAATEAAHHAGGTIALSGAAVMIGFAALTLVPLNELQSIGIGGMIVVGVSVVMATTLLPAVLAWLGPRVDAGRIGRPRARPGATEQRWRRWGARVVAHPRLVLLVAGLPVLLLAWQARRMNADLPRGNWLPPNMESAIALDDLGRMQRGGVVNSLRVLLDLPAGVSALDTTGWDAIGATAAAVSRDRRVARVQSLRSAMPGDRPNPILISVLPDAVRRSLLSTDERATILEVVPHDTVDFNELTQLARDLRRIDVARETGLGGAAIRVGGMPAFNADYVDAINARVLRVGLLIVVTTLVALMIGFRSILVPIKALGLNLLSVAAAFGAVVLVFQDGHGIRLLGLDGPLGAVFPAVPLLVFCTVFGLSMDYEVFLVARVAEARTRMTEDEAIVEGLARTGGVITSAAAIMITVFAAFTLGDFLFMKVLGFALAVAVLIDATLVRMAIGPALLQLAGRWNWWPGKQSAAPRSYNGKKARGERGAEQPPA